MSRALVPPELLDPVVAFFQPRRVILFGSVARGEAGPDSDIDLLVIVDDDTPAEMLTIRAGIDARMSYRHPADVIPCREAIFRRKARIAGTLAYEAAHSGTVVYERP
jgi:predicted nucleotidyltransferase